MNQYELDTVAEYGGVAMKIDRNSMDGGRGSVAPRAKGTCGVCLGFADHRHLAARDAGRAGQGRPVPAQEETHVRRAPARPLRQGDLARSPLLPAQPGPPGHRPDDRPDLDRKVAVSGVFRRGTTKAVRAYQRERGLKRTRVVTRDLWNDLKTGRR